MQEEPPFPEWLRPPYEGFGVDDLFRLNGLPEHTQLIDGSLVPRAPQSAFHSVMNTLLAEELRRGCPDGWAVRREMVVICGPRQALEPDVCVVRAAACTDRTNDRYAAEDVRLVVETVMPDSEIRDWHRKQQIYARSGIRHSWIVTRGERGTVAQVNTYELDLGTMTYGCTGIHHDHLKVTVPFGMTIDLTAIRRM